MKKVLLSLFFIATSMGITKLSAYCTYNWSKNDTITIFIYSKRGPIGVLFTQKTRHVLKPGGKPGCWNWKEIDKKNKNKQWFFRAYKGNRTAAQGALAFGVIASGNFPIGGAILFEGYDRYRKPIISIYYDGNKLEKESKAIKKFKA